MVVVRVRVVLMLSLRLRLRVRVRVRVRERGGKVGPERREGSHLLVMVMVRFRVGVMV